MDEARKRQQAAALRFEPAKEDSPRLIAGGSGVLAEEILRIAREENRPIVQDPALAEFLHKLPVGREIPENLYKIVAILFASIYRLNQRL